MEPINIRFKELREHLNISQKTLGEALGLSNSGISNIENGIRNVTDKHIKLLCVTFNVNEEWLRNGTGEMLVQSDNTIFSEVAAQYHLEDMEKEILRIFLELDANQRAAVKDFAFSLVDAVLNTPSLQSEYFSRTGCSVPIAAMGGGVRTIGRKQFDDDLISHPDSDNDDLKG